MANNNQGGSVAIWVAVIAALGGIAVAYVNLSGSSSSGPSDTDSTDSVCVGSEFSTEGDNSAINCTN